MLWKEGRTLALIKTTTRIQYKAVPFHDPFHGEQYLVNRALKREPGHLGSDLVIHLLCVACK